MGIQDTDCRQVWVQILAIVMSVNVPLGSYNYTFVSYCTFVQSLVVNLDIIGIWLESPNFSIDLGTEQCVIFFET